MPTSEKRLLSCLLVGGFLRGGPLITITRCKRQTEQWGQLVWHDAVQKKHIIILVQVIQYKKIQYIFTTGSFSCTRILVLPLSVVTACLLKTVRVQKLVQHFYLCMAQQQQGGKLLWHKQAITLSSVWVTVWKFWQKHQHSSLLY